MHHQTFFSRFSMNVTCSGEFPSAAIEQQLEFSRVSDATIMNTLYTKILYNASACSAFQLFSVVRVQLAKQSDLFGKTHSRPEVGYGRIITHFHTTVDMISVRMFTLPQTSFVFCIYLHLPIGL